MSSLKKTDHFYLIDSSGYIFHAYYALPLSLEKVMDFQLVQWFLLYVI